jgi:hypothetical protein
MLLDSGAPHRCNDSGPEPYLHQTEREHGNDPTRYDGCFPKAEDKVQDKVGKKAWY